MVSVERREEGFEDLGSLEGRARPNGWGSKPPVYA